MQPTSPKTFVVALSWKNEAQVVYSGCVGVSERQRVHFCLPGDVLCVQTLRAAVEIQLMLRGGRQFFLEIFKKWVPADGPVGAQAARAAKHLRIFAHSVKGNQPTHGGTHQTGLASPAMRAVVRVNEGFDHLDNPAQIKVRAYLFDAPVRIT